jgi:hypothetical protein
METVKLSQEVGELITLLPVWTPLDEGDSVVWIRRIFVVLLTFDRGPYSPVERRPTSVEYLLSAYTEDLRA